MCNTILKISLFMVTVIEVAASCVKNLDKDNYVSQESRDLTENNRVIDSSSKEDYDDGEITTERVILFKNRIETTPTPEDLENSTISLFDSSSVVPAKYAFNTFECNDKKATSSEENLCKSTLVDYPYSASIQRKGAHYASGALIDEHTVLTAAGVFYYVRESIKLFRIRLGSVDCKTGGVLVPIKEVTIHPSYELGKLSFDVALIKLGIPVQETDYIKPIPLSRVKQDVISAKFLTTYWPRLIVNGTVLPQKAKERLKHRSMRVSIQKMIPWKTCADLLKARTAVLDETSLCLKPVVTHHSHCMPDVGAPVIAEDGLWGVTSGWISRNCATYPSPTVVTRTAMAPVRAWIESLT